jgi:hypothetical protein
MEPSNAHRFATLTKSRRVAWILNSSHNTSANLATGTYALPTGAPGGSPEVGAGTSTGGRGHNTACRHHCPAPSPPPHPLQTRALPPRPRQRTCKHPEYGVKVRSQGGAGARTGASLRRRGVLPPGGPRSRATTGTGCGREWGGTRAKVSGSNHGAIPTPLTHSGLQGTMNAAENGGRRGWGREGASRVDGKSGG